MKTIAMHIRVSIIIIGYDHKREMWDSKLWVNELVLMDCWSMQMMTTGKRQRFLMAICGAKGIASVVLKQYNDKGHSRKEKCSVLVKRKRLPHHEKKEKLY